MSNKDLKGLEIYGLANLGEIRKNLTAPELYEEIIRNGEGKIAKGGSMVCLTGAVTGRSPKDKFIVEEDTTKSDVNWSKGNGRDLRGLNKDRHRHYLRNVWYVGLLLFPDW